MPSNFSFIEAFIPKLASIGTMAEQYLYSDTNTCIIKLGMFAETIVNLMFKLDDIPFPSDDNTHANRIKTLRYKGLIPNEISDMFYTLRISRNNAVTHMILSSLKKITLTYFDVK